MTEDPDNDDFGVVVTASAIRDLERLPEKIATAVAEFVTSVLPTQPWRLSKPLRRELEGWRTARRGDYRVVFRIDTSEHQLVVGRVEHRSTAYRPR